MYFWFMSNAILIRLGIIKISSVAGIPEAHEKIPMRIGTGRWGGGGGGEG